MTVFWSLVFVVISLWVGVLTHNFERDVTPPTSELQAEAVGSDLLLYRNAVETYALSNSTAGASKSMNVPNDSLTIPPGVRTASLPSTLGNMIVPDGQGGRIIYSWVSAPAGAAFELFKTLGGDATIGTSTGTSWVSPQFGAMGTLPVAVPAGYLISVVELGN